MGNSLAKKRYSTVLHPYGGTRLMRTSLAKKRYSSTEQYPYISCDGKGKDKGTEVSIAIAINRN